MADTNLRRSGTGSDYARFLGIGIVLLVILSVLVAIGFFVDKLLGTLPLFLLVGLAIGFAAGLYYLYLVLEKLSDG